MNFSFEIKPMKRTVAANVFAKRQKREQQQIDAEAARLQEQGTALAEKANFQGALYAW
jgi:hypothetical protein